MPPPAADSSTTGPDATGPGTVDDTGTSGTTGDPLDAIADVCEEARLWLVPARSDRPALEAGARRYAMTVGRSFALALLAPRLGYAPPRRTEVVLSDDSVKVPTDARALSPEAEQRLAELAQRLKSENRNVYLEIQGHTDARGPVPLNQRLGAERAARNEEERESLHQQRLDADLAPGLDAL